MYLSFFVARCLVCAFITSTLVHVTESSKILLLPFSAGSHVLYFREIGRDLAAKGHHVEMILNPTYPGLELEKRHSFLTVQVPHHNHSEIYDNAMTPDMWDGYLRTTAAVSAPVQEFAMIGEQFYGFCVNTLSDERLFMRLNASRFDFALIDGFLGARCLYALVYRLGVPYASLSTLYEPWLTRTPSLPSYVPFMMGTPYTERMTFYQRLTNAAWLVYYTAVMRQGIRDDALVQIYVPDKPYKTLTQLAGESLLFFQDTDVVLDYARPRMPSIIDVGGLLIQNATPLIGELGEFVQGAGDEGVVVASFGTFAPRLPQEWVDIMVEAFKKLPYKVVLRNPGNLPSTFTYPNILVQSWIPQNFLLAHNNTRLFVSHCGNNGQFEAVYHQVPLLCLPMFGEQRYNAIRGEYKGYAAREDLTTLTADKLRASIISAVNNHTMLATVRALSRIYKSRPDTARGRVVHWIEHVIQYGGQSYQSHAIHMPWYQYMMIDLVVFVLLVVVSVGYVLCKILGCCISMCRIKRKEKVP